MDGKIYVFGGLFSQEISTDVVEMYDIANGEWTAKNKLPEPMCCMSAVALDGKIYLVGGSSTFATEAWSRVYEYDPIMDSYTAKPNLPEPRRFLTASVLGDEIYAIGGFALDQVYNSVVKYQPSNGTEWVAVAPLNEKRFFSASEVWNGKIYVIGGAKNTALYELATMEIFDPATPTAWIISDAELQTGRLMHGSGIVSGHLFIMGGTSVPDELGSVEQLDLTAGNPAWVSDTPMNSTRRVYAAVEAGGKIYVAGGISNNTALNSFHEFTPGFTAVSEMGFLDALIVYPNPALSSFTLRLQGNPREEITIDIFGSAGRKVFGETVKFHGGVFLKNISTAEIPAGIYFIRVSDARSSNIHKIIIR